MGDKVRMLTDLPVNLKTLIETVDARLLFGRGDVAVSHDTHEGMCGPVCVGLEVGWGRGKKKKKKKNCICVRVCLC